MVRRNKNPALCARKPLFAGENALPGRSKSVMLFRAGRQNFAAFF
jgi:hypothetical protein